MKIVFTANIKTMAGLSKITNSRKGIMNVVFLNDKGSTAFLKDETATAFSKPVSSYKLCTTIEELLFALNTPYEDEHYGQVGRRAKENKIWLLSSDITGKQEGRIAYGSTSIINHDGQIVQQVPFM